MDILRIVIGWLLVWGLGVALVRLAYARRGTTVRPQTAWRAGTGLLLGAFVLTLYMRVLGRIGAPFTIASIGIPLIVALAALLVAQRNPLLDSLRHARASL